MEFVYATGGREKYFKATNVGDCVTRAICNATGKDYKEVYDRLAVLTKERRYSKRERHYAHESPRNGVFTRVAKKYLEEELGWVWVPCMTIGSGCQVHVDEKELPSKGNIILNLSKHFTCVKDGVLYDTYDCSRDGTRCVYGYWRAPTKAEADEWMNAKHLSEVRKQALEARKEEKRIKVQEIKKSHSKKISSLMAKIKKYQHELKLEQNRMNREIEKLEESYK